MRHEARPRQLRLRPRHAGALHRRRRRAEDQAHPAQRQGAARHRHPARHPRLPHRDRPLPRDPREDRPVLRRRPRGRHRRARRRERLQVPVNFADQNVDEIVLRLLRIEAEPRDLGPWKAMLERLANPVRRSRHRHRRQVRRLRRFLQEPQGVAAARRPRAQPRTRIRWVESESITRESPQAETRTPR